MPRTTSFSLAFRIVFSLAIGIVLAFMLPSVPLLADQAGETAATATTLNATQLAADTLLTTPSRATFQAAKGWFHSMADGRTVLEDPDHELTVTMIEIQAKTGGEAIAAAWKQARPDFARSERQTVTPPARDGWDEIVQTIYVTKTEEKRTVLALARRKGETWFVHLVDAADAALDRRGAQLQTALASFKAPGVEKESFTGRAPHALDGEHIKALADFVEQARLDADVPGAAIAVVKDGQILFEQGFGVRERGRAEKVTPNTLFLIGSTTKSLTTLMMARLVDAGKLSWDSPVTKLYPDFALADTAVTRQLTLKHTVCACTGLPRQDMEFLFEFADGTPEKTVASMRTMKPTTGFGETFQYSNTMVSTGGYVAAHVAEPDLPLGPAYDQAMRSFVFGPLRMTATTFDFAQAVTADHASPHGMDLHLKTALIPLSIERALIPVRPAGGAWSSAHDMARFLELELARGVSPDGTRLVSEENLLRRREPQVKVTDVMSYGLGLFTEKDHGIDVVHHGGNTLGFTSDMFLLPDQGIGVVLLANTAGANAFRSTIRRRLFEILFDGRNEAKETLAFALSRRKESTDKVLAETTFEVDPSWIGPLVGTYSDPSLGRVELRFDGSSAVFDAGEWQSPVAKWRGPDGVVKLLLTGAPFAGLDLLPGQKGGNPTLSLDLSQQQYVFTRM